LVEAYALLGGLDALRHLLLLGDLRRLGAGHLVELAADASFIVWMRFLEMGELPLDDVMRLPPR
jgi:aryl carrier-like protein